MPTKGISCLQQEFGVMLVQLLVIKTDKWKITDKSWKYRYKSHLYLYLSHNTPRPQKDEYPWSPSPFQARRGQATLSSGLHSGDFELQTWCWTPQRETPAQRCPRWPSHHVSSVPSDSAQSVLSRWAACVFCSSKDTARETSSCVGSFPSRGSFWAWAL